MQSGQLARYARHLVLKEIGGPGQAALLGAHVVIVGAGGLGGPAGLYLAAAGCGRITVIDDDVVEASNLQRQVQFVTTDIGMSKALAMADTLTALNPDVEAIAEERRLRAENAQTLLSGGDIVLDGTDSFDTRFTINAACLALGVPLVSGALGRFNGQLAAFKNDGSGPCYRCLVPEAPPDAETCAAIGVVGALAGVIGAAMALETIKIITGAGTPLYGGLSLYDGLSSEARRVRLPNDPACPACG